MSVFQKTWKLILVCTLIFFSKDLLAQNFSIVKAGNEFSVGLRSDGSLWVWGKNDKGQLGLGHNFNTSTATKVSLQAPVTDFAPGMEHVIVVLNDGTVWTWGDNSFGQLGLGNTGNSYNTPQQVQTACKAVGAGWYFSFTIKNNGVLFACGDNSSGQLGDGSTTDRNSFVQIGSLNYTVITGGADHALAIGPSSALYSWGANDKGQLGHGDQTNRNTPTSVGGNYNEIAAGNKRSGAITSSYVAELWGDYKNTAATSPEAIGVSGLNIYLKCFNETFYFYSLVGADYDLYAIGENATGQFGTGNSNSTAMPIIIYNGSPSDLPLPGPGYDHTLYIKNAEFVICGAGSNNYGQLGFTSSDDVLTTTCRVFYSGEGLHASTGESDSRIQLTWDIPVTDAHRSHNPEVYIQISDISTGEEIYSEILDSINNYTSISGTFNHFVRPDQQISYELRVLEYGPGTVLLDKFGAIGSTLPFQQPDLQISTVNPWSIDLQLNSNSDYDTKLLLYREDSLIAVLDTSKKSYSDLCVPRSSKHIQNGMTYEYSLMSVNTLYYDSISAAQSVIGSTFDANFVVPDDIAGTTLKMDWNDLSSYVTGLTISRDGNLIAELDPYTQSYTDLNPIPGNFHHYKLNLILDEVKMLALPDSGSIKANGLVSGYLINDESEGDFTVPNVEITLEGSVNGRPFSSSTRTDVNGHFSFTEVPYHLETEFTLSSGVSEDVTLVLNQEQPEQIVFLEATVPSAETEPVGFRLLSFETESIDSMGQVLLRWEVNKTDTIHYYLYRGSELIAVNHQKSLKDSFIDEGGEPLASYTYSIRSYRRTFNTSSGEYEYAFEDAKSSIEQFPNPKAVKQGDFVVTRQTNKANVLLSWSHPGGNIDGFRVYRSDSLIAKLGSAERSFTDLDGKCLEDYVYSINVFRDHEEEIFSSSKVFSDITRYPNLTAISTVNATARADSTLLINWVYSVNAEYNYTGFLVMREANGSVDTIARIRKERPLRFIDRTGVPGQSYKYTVAAFKESIYSIGNTSASINLNYPKLPKLRYAQIYPFVEGMIQFYTGVDSVYSYLDVAIQNKAQTKTYAMYRSTAFGVGIPWNDYSDEEVEFALCLIKNVNGTYHYGDDTTIVKGQTNTSGPYELDTVSNLIASTQYSSHVRLSWDYPNYYKPSFRIFRDGSLIATLEGVQKTYFDHTVYDNEPHIYMVQVFLDNKKSKRKSAVGKRAGNSRVFGTAYTLEGKEGIPNARVILLFPDSDGERFVYFDETITNSSGYYEFVNVPTYDLQEGFEVQVICEHPDAQFIDNQVEFVYYDSIKAYTANFIDTLPNLIPSSEEIATPIDIVAIVNDQNQSVDIRWQASNANYTSFEVYRGLVLIGRVPASQTKLVIDKEGLPGYDYSYRVRAIWEKDLNTTIEGEYQTVVQTFPAILPVENLTASIYNDAIKVNWSHSSDHGLDYYILRNGELFWVVESGMPMEFTDSFGTAGSVYKYSVIPVLSRDNSVQGLEISTTAVFPRVSQIQSLSASHTINGVRLTWTVPTDRSHNVILYLEGEALDTFFMPAGIKGNTRTIFNFDGVPEVSNEYAMAIMYESNDVRYRGKLTRINYTHAALSPVSLSTSTKDYAVQLGVIYYFAQSQDAGIEFYNNTTGQLIGSVSFEQSENNNYILTDNISLPETSYEYKARLFWTRGGVIYYSDYASYSYSTITYPKLAPPTNVTARLVDGSLKEISWEHPREDVQFEIRRINVCGTPSTIQTVSGNKRLFKDANNYTDFEIKYDIKAVLIANTSTFSSEFTQSNSISGGEGVLLVAGSNKYNIGTGSNLFGVTQYDRRRWQDMQGGYDHVIALESDGSLWSWGGNGNGQLGLENTTNQTAAEQVGTDKDWVQISANNSFVSAAIKENGTLWIWGYGGYGQTGQGSSSNVLSPTQVGSDSNWVYVHAGFYCVFAIKSDGTLWGTGRTNFSTYSFTFTQIGTDTDWKKVESSVDHVLALKQDGTLWGWGKNTYGQLGLGHKNGVSTPTRIGTNRFIDFACGGYHSVLIDQFRRVYTCGLNNYGQLGDGTLTDKTTLTYVMGTGCRANAGIQNTSVTSAGTYVWGRNINGELGIGNTTSQQTPYYLGNYDKISLGYQFSLGIVMYDGSVANFEATDGTLETKVQLEWDDASGYPDIDKLHIYRDGELIGIETSDKTSFTDLDAVPGMKHIYSIRVLMTTGGQTAAVSDIGWRKAAGIVKGDVVTFVGNQPVPDVDVKLKVETKDGNYYYSTKSDNNGRFRFEGVYYGEQGVAYASATYLDHEFVEDTLSAELDLTVTSLGIGTFIDKSANLISGTIAQRDSECPIDSVPITLIKHYASSADVEETKFSDEEGKYSFSVNPYEADLVSFELELADIQVRGVDSVYHDWDRNNVVISKSAVSVNTPAEDFYDQLSVPYTFSVNNSCGNYPGIKFSLDINSTDGCYESTIVSNDNGVFPTTYLPPQKYIVTVNSASPLTADIVPILEYLSLRPLKLDLSDYGTNERGDSSLQQLYAKEAEFTYHNLPDISLTRGGGIETVACNPDILLVYGQGDPNHADANVTLAVLETHKGVQCHVKEGYLVVKNGASIDGDLRIDFDPSTGTFPDYIFTPGLPETVAPYYKTLTVEYHNKFGFVSQDVYQVLVAGKAPQPGSDVIVSSEEGKDFQIPLAVLRDPPGDGSYSYLEEGVESVKTFSVDQSFGGSVNLSASTTLGILGIGMEVSASAGVGGAEQNSNELTFSHTTTQRFETSAASDIANAQGTEFQVGDNADLIIGTGMALKYGIIESIIYDPATCTVTKSTEIGISPDKLTTTWAYTVDHIETLILEYENILKLAREGRLTIEDNSGGSEPKDSNFYRTLIDNWKSVLNYHRYNTLPHVNLCDKKLFDASFDTDDVPWGVPRSTAETVKEAAQSFQEDCFCSAAGSYDGNDNFVLNADFKWTDETLLKYRIARMRLGELQEYFRVLAEDIPTGPGYSPPSLDKYNDNDDAWEKKLDDGDEFYAENLTFSGLASIEKSYSYSVSSNSTYTQHIYGDASVYAGIMLISEFDVSTWAGIGAGVNVATTQAIDVETRAGVELTFDFNIENQASQEQTTTNTSGYVLSDDDPGDQFSVTVIKGIEQMHTPYFELFAGRSSCPYEPGTIPRDRPEIQLEYSDGSPFPNNVLRDLDPEAEGFFALKLVNKAPEIFNEYRYYNLVVAPNSNQNGAFLTAFGAGSYYPVTYKILSGSSTYAGMLVGSNGIYYDYSDLKMQLIPTCLDTDVDLVDGFNAGEINLEAYFRQPCSGVSILSPGNNWRLIQSRNAFGQPDEKILIQIGDYDPENVHMENITLQYRRLGSNVWTDISGSQVSADSLQSYYDLYRTVYRDPVYNFIWDVHGQSEIIDGEYEIRAYVNCGLEGKVYSNVVSGVIDRNALALYGVPKPEDGVLNIGESVEVVFNEPVECGYETKTAAHYLFARKSDGLVLSFTPICNGNSIIYQFDGDLDTLNGEVISMAVFDVQDLNGNTLQDTVFYEFEVQNTPVSWKPYSLTVDVYKGESKLINLELENTGAAKANVDLSLSGLPADLLSLFVLSDSIAPHSSNDVPLRVDAINADIGTYTFTVSADVSTFTKNYGNTDVQITVNVLPEAPEWKIPPGKSMSSVVVCNFEIDGNRSVDTMDKIAISIDNEVRGYDNIYKSKAGTNLYYAVINVQGDPEDVGKQLEYRIWDASAGAEYDGSMSNGEIYFDGGIYGSTLNPRIIEVDTEWDSVRYIPLIAGWNWLAFNYQKESMDVDDMLGGLSLRGGEVIKTLNTEAIFNDSTGTWFATSGGLSSINTANGYLLFLHKDDVLRISGKNAEFKQVLIADGWSLIGNPYQENIDINSAFVANSDIEDGAILKTGGAINKASVMESGSWTGGITEYEVYQSYMLFNTKQTILRYKTEHDSFAPGHFEYNLTILGSVLWNGSEHRVDGDYIIAEIDGEFRGVGVLEEAKTPASRYVLNMFVYGDSADLGKAVNFKIYRQSTGQYYEAFTNDSIVFTPDLHKGYPNKPYWFSNEEDALSIDPITFSENIGVQVYPNPHDDHFTVKLTLEHPHLTEIVMYDMFGKKVFTGMQSCYTGENTIGISTEGLVAGTYVVWLKVGDQTNVVKVIKE